MALRITPRSPPPLTPEASRRVRALTRAAFSWRRKQLGTILRRHPDLRCSAAWVEEALAERSLAATLRPERLSPDDFVALSRALAEGSR